MVALTSADGSAGGRRISILSLILSALVVLAGVQPASSSEQPGQGANRGPGDGHAPGLARARQQEASFLFSGSVFEGQQGDESRPLPGVWLEIYVTDDDGERTTDDNYTQTDGNGWYGLAPDDASLDAGRAVVIALEVPEGYVFAGADSVGGQPAGDAPLIVYESPESGQRVWDYLSQIDPVRTGNRFWLQPVGRPEGEIDLTIGEMSVEGIEEGQMVIAAEVGNMGSSESPPTMVVAGNPELEWWGSGEGLDPLGPGEWQWVWLWLPIPDYLWGQTVDVFVYVDPENDVPEANEENNSWWEPGVVIDDGSRSGEEERPDLIVAYENHYFEAGGGVLVMVVTVENAGEAPAGASDLVVTAPGWAGAGSRVAPLEPGEWRTLELPLDVPDDAHGARTTFTLGVDANGEVAEIDEANNFDSQAVGIDETRAGEDEWPDLVVNYEDHYFEDGERRLVLGLAVGNEGEAPAGPSQVGIMAPGWAYRSSRVPPLEPGEWEWVEVSLSVPDDQRGQRVSFALEVDPDGEIEELNEGNNFAETPRLQMPEPERGTDGEREEDERPDLTVDYERSFLEDGRDTLVLVVEVANRGETRAGEQELRATAAGWEAGSGRISPLDPGRRRTVFVRLDVPAAARGREPSFMVEVDADDEVDESNEGNNRTRTPQLEIPPLLPGGGDDDGSGVEVPPWLVPVVAGIALVLVAAGAIQYFRGRGDGPPEEEPGETVLPPLPPLRLLRLWVTEGATGAGAPVADDRPLAAGGAYTLHLQVQPRGGEAGEAVGRERELDVVFFAPAADFGLERRATLRLPERGPSNEIRRPFVPARRGRRQIRAAVYYRNTLLQSAVLEATVADRGAPAQAGAVARLVDYVASARLDDLEQYARPALNIFVNSSGRDSHWLGVFAGQEGAARGLKSGDPHTFAPSELEILAQRTRQVLRKVEGQRTYSHRRPFPLDAAKVARRERDLVDLARNGYELFDALFLSHEGGLADERLDNFDSVLQEPGIISVARCRSGSPSLPWAAIYDRYIDVDKELSLCPVFKQQVVENEWTDDHQQLVRKRDLLDAPQECRAQRRCPLKNDDTRKTTVCPFGFWGFMHQVEQPLQQVTPTPLDEVPPELEAAAFDQTMYLERQAQKPVAMALGVYPRLGDAKDHRAEFEKLAQDHDLTIRYETDRDQILALLEAGGQHLYYFYCHGVADGDTFKLKVGPKENPGYISSSNLDPRAIKWPPEPHPLVILNGCETMALTPERIHGFMGKLRRLGAAGVIGSEVKVWSSLARPFGLLVVGGLLEGRSLGEAFLDTRRQLQRQLNPSGLIYAYYASAGLHVHDDEDCAWCRTHRAGSEGNGHG